MIVLMYIYLKLVSKLQLHCVIVWFSLVPLNCSHILCALTVNPIAKHSHTQNNTDDSLMNSHSLLNLFNKFILMESSTYKKKQCARAHTWIYLNEEKEKKTNTKFTFPEWHLMLKNKVLTNPPPTPHTPDPDTHTCLVLGVLLCIYSVALVLCHLLFLFTPTPRIRMTWHWAKKPNDAT